MEGKKIKIYLFQIAKNAQNTFQMHERVFFTFRYSRLLLMTILSVWSHMGFAHNIQ